MGAIFLNEGYQRLHDAERQHDVNLGKLYATLCPVDAVPLRPDGSCGTCGRQLRPAGPQPGMTEQEAKQAAFWLRYNREKAQREQASAPKPKAESRESSLTERAKKFIGRDGLPIAMD